MNGEPVFIRRADHGARILVVDDEPLVRRSLRATLERSHYEVAEARDGEDALALLQSFRPDLVILDIQMPGIDGLEVCHRIREMPNGNLLPIIFLTGDERRDIYALAFQAKGDDFLRKPVHPAEMVVRIRSLMRLKRLQGEVVAERDSLLDLHRQRESLFHFIVHDLKNPLSAIQIGLDLLEANGTQGPAAQVQLHRLRDTAQYMGRMIQDILDIGRAEQVGLELHRTRIRLGTWIPELLKELDAHSRHRHQILTWDCPEGLEVDADPDFLRRLLLNLLDNAIKYSPPGTPARILAGATANGVRLEVRDQGPGIPAHLREKIFGKFVRLEEREGIPHLGSGLGLAFCQLAAQAHDGQIWVEDNPEGGSIFVVELPAPELANSAGASA